MTKGFISPKNLWALRKRKGWSQKKLSEKSKVTERSIVSYENSEKSKVSLTQRNLRKLASALKVPPEVLSGDSDLPKEEKSLEIPLRLHRTTRLNLDLIEHKYGFTIEDIMNVAPLLFVKAAREANIFQFQKLRQDQAIWDSYDSSDEAAKAIFKDGSGALPKDFDSEEYFELRQIAANNNDLTEAIVFENYGDENDISSHINPFAIYLYDECTKHQLGSMDVYSSRYFDYFSNLSIPEYFVCDDELEKVTCGSHEAGKALKHGVVTLEDIPDELREPREAGKRVAWLEGKYYQSSFGKGMDPLDYFGGTTKKENDSESAEPKPECDICMDKTYMICKQDDGFLAVKRCDACSEDKITDQQAAALAEADDIGVSHEPPYYLADQENPDDWE